MICASKTTLRPRLCDRLLGARPPGPGPGLAPANPHRHRPAGPFSPVAGGTGAAIPRIPHRLDAVARRNIRRLAPATINRKRAAVMAIWTDAAARGQAPPVPQSRSPLDRVPKRIEPERVPVTWSLPEIDRIFAAAARLPGAWEGVRVSLCWVLGLLLFWDTGGRLAEVLAARCGSWT